MALVHGAEDEVPLRHTHHGLAIGEVGAGGEAGDAVGGAAVEGAAFRGG